MFVGQLGYQPTEDDALFLKQLYEDQAVLSYGNGQYPLAGPATEYGQPIEIQIQVPGASGQPAQTVTSGWLIRPDGRITLSTPLTSIRAK